MEKKQLIEKSIEAIIKLIKNVIDGGKSEKISRVLSEYNDKSIVKKLNKEIEKETGLYLGEINPFHVFGLYIVQPKQDNERIIRQQSAFYVYGLLTAETQSPIIHKYKAKARIRDANWYPDNLPNRIKTNIEADGKYDSIIIKYIIPESCSDKIASSLRNLGIDSTTIYPELQERGEFLSHKYSTRDK